MIDTRPLFPSTPAPRLKRPGSTVPTLPPVAKAPPEVWTIRFTAAPGNDAPPICRMRMLLKTAWRRHRLRATIVAQTPPAATPGDSAASISSDGAAMRQTGCNKLVRGP
ncbi:MAG: hypothetical protein ACP5I8_15550 [Phycisphaerae bacterium]